MHHVYGNLGALSDRTYDGQVDTTSLNIARRSLRVVHERVETSDVLANVHEALQDAERIAFIGFGFDPVNMMRLQLKSLTPGKQIIGSALGLTDAEKGHVLLRAGGGIALGGHAQDGLSALRSMMILDDERTP